MRNFAAGIIAALGLILNFFTANAQNYAWPANYEGVMLQGFYWDSYSDTKWTNLTANADELSTYFKLIWVPNSGFCSNSNNMGYMPVYWFTNHNSSFGTEEELLEFIAAYKERGTGIIADVVVNHRNGVSNWTDFPSEEWNGTTWSIGPEGICSNDEVRNASGQAKPTGAPDTGDNFDGARDLDHINFNVQNNVKNYCLCLLQKYGYTGFRYDMVKGYAGGFNKIYNEYAKPSFSVGEYWDGNYDAVKAWIDATGKQSAAFDFPFKYAVNDAFSSNDLTKLVWKANGTTNQPAGMIHYGYAQYAVTFIDNHDTYRDGSKFTGNVLAANAFMLCSPGTPCVFLPHYKGNKSAIQTLINIRNSVGIHNMSEVNVLKSTRDCYLAEVTGSKGSLVVRIGSANDVPAGFTSDDIKASGTGYCIWSKTEIVGGTTVVDNNTTYNIYFDNSASNWSKVYAYTYGNFKDDSLGFWPGSQMSLDATSGYYRLTTTADIAGCNIIFSNNAGTQTGDGVAVVNNGIYKFAGNKVATGVYTGQTYDSGIDGIETETPAAEYYTLQGIPVENPRSGIFIRLCAGKAAKVLIK